MRDCGRVHRKPAIASSCAARSAPATLHRHVKTSSPQPCWITPQHLARLRDEWVATCREGQVLHYQIADGRIRRLLDAVYDIYRTDEPGTAAPR